MEETLKDIKTKLEGRFYQNEEHVRFSIVARILQQLGWDIWNPQEVIPEFYGTPNEDKTRIDMALCPNLGSPSVFIEVKSVGKIDATLADVEIQLRDYNRNLTAIFSIITDGQKWRFYYSRAGGEFSEKCFKVIDLLKDDLSNVESSLKTFLAKSEIINENAEKNAKSYLQLNQKQRAMENAYQQALKKITEPPFPSLPQALFELVASAVNKITFEEAEDFIKKKTFFSNYTSYQG
ncbi:MAG: type I restriction enzyme HsdR N-terminal domain-containing protein [Euryarchaeota archaeon]|nr:type I restriction enzyme HsdR N-terminal domain-containing protein [Euryarchaeota archaeon]